MNYYHLKWALLALLLSCGSCQRKQDPVSELEKTVQAMASSEGVPETDSGWDGPTGLGSPSEQMKGAMDDYKAGRFEDAVTRLQLLRSMAALSPQQRMALQDSMAAVMTEIYTMAEQGDARAQAAVLQYERMQSGR
jgi:hypothetical protein